MDLSDDLDKAKNDEAIRLRHENKQLRSDLADVIRLLVDEHDTHHENCCVEPDDMCHVGQVLARVEAER